MSESLLPTNLSKNDNNNSHQSFSVAAFLVKFYNTTLHEENNFPPTFLCTWFSPSLQNQWHKQYVTTKNVNQKQKQLNFDLTISHQVFSLKAFPWYEKDLECIVLNQLLLPGMWAVLYILHVLYGCSYVHCQGYIYHRESMYQLWENHVISHRACCHLVLESIL